MELKYNTLIFYDNRRLVSEIYPSGAMKHDEKIFHISEEQKYKGKIFQAYANGGLLGENPERFVGREERREQIAVGKLVELVSKDEEWAGLRARVSNVKYNQKEGIYLTSSSAEEIKARGSKTWDERNNYHRLEFDPIKGDEIAGMFYRWQEFCQSEDVPMNLLLWIPKSKVVTIPGN